MHATDALLEANRLMTVCNACRYCEGLCAVFPAMEMRRTFNDSDLNYLANLCHQCGACLPDCQYAPPHQFDVNVPATLAKLRNDSYAVYAWPSFLSGAFASNGATMRPLCAPWGRISITLSPSIQPLSAAPRIIEYSPDT